MTTPAIPRMLTCGSYHSGHDVHWIQAKRSQDPPHRAGAFVVSADGWITGTLDDGEERRLWNHDPIRLRALLATTDGYAVLRSASVLAVPSEDGHYCVSVTSEPSPCPDPNEDVSDLPLDELLRARGGFTMTVDEVNALLER